MRLLNPESARPFEFRAGDIGVLLIHGFTGSPREMLDLGKHLSHHGVSSIGPLLPGHGTMPADLNLVSWRQWHDAVLDAHDSLARHCETVFAAGLSMGAVLALHLAAHRPLAGVGAFSSFLRPADWRHPFVEILKHVLWFEKKSRLDIEDPDGRREFAGYDVYPSWGAAQMLRLCKHLEEELEDVRCPVVLMHGSRDWTVHPDQMETIARRLCRSSEVTTITLPRSGHVVTLDFERGHLCTEFHRFLKRHTVRSPRRDRVEA